jgi:hypothetical protein
MSERGVQRSSSSIDSAFSFEIRMACSEACMQRDHSCMHFLSSTHVNVQGMRVEGFEGRAATRTHNTALRANARARFSPDVDRGQVGSKVRGTCQFCATNSPVRTSQGPLLDRSEWRVPKTVLWSDAGDAGGCDRGSHSVAVAGLRARMDDRARADVGLDG